MGMPGRNRCGSRAYPRLGRVVYESRTRSPQEPDRGPKPRRGMTAVQRRRLRVPRTGLYEQAATRLRLLIVRGDLALGQQLLETDLSDALGVSRPALREV